MLLPKFASWEGGLAPAQDTNLPQVELKVPWWVARDLEAGASPPSRPVRLSKPLIWFDLNSLPS